MQVSVSELRQLFTSVGQRSGWDFSRVRLRRELVPWDYLTVVQSSIAPHHEVLDLGTGGGEKLLTLSSLFGRGVGTDISEEMIEQAKRNKENTSVSNVEFFQMDSQELLLSDGSFDRVFCRHSPVNPRELVRVLRPRGIFITQQVAQRNTQNIFEAFNWVLEDCQEVELLARSFEELGCRVVSTAEYDVEFWFEDLHSLIFWLKSVPLPERFDLEKHFSGINEILKRYGGELGIESNEHRQLLIVQKL